MHECMYICCVYMYVYAYMYMYAYMCVLVCAHVDMCVHVYMCVLCMLSYIYPNDRMC